MEKSGGSKLMQMQARFQQKQLQERGLKIASLYEAQQARALDRVRQSPAKSNGVDTTDKATPPAPIPHHPGKVRQMFEERRTKAGIDKSYPLQPIHNNADRGKKVNGTTRTTRVTERTSKANVTHSTVKHSTVRKQVKSENHIKTENHVKTVNHVNGSGDVNHNHMNHHQSTDNNMNSVRMIPISNGDSLELSPGTPGSTMLEDETFPEALAPTPTPRESTPQHPETEPKRPPRRSSSTKTSPIVKMSTPPPVAPPRKAERKDSGNVVSEEKPKGGMQRVPNPGTAKKSSASLLNAKPSASSTRAVATSEPGATCTVCGRHFAPDRLAKHQDICKRTSTKKRKPFDVLKHRLAGTEAEPFISKLRKGPSQAKVKPLNNTWRQKHEEFINAIRAAKQVQAHLNAGGKLSDLPPPPPSENPDYVQCPHCQRRFNQAAADRHIPKCANYSYNKPKPGQGAKKR